MSVSTKSNTTSVNISVEIIVLLEMDDLFSKKNSTFVQIHSTLFIL